MTILRTLIQTKTVPSSYMKYRLWQTDHYRYEIEMIHRSTAFTKTVPLNLMAFEEACELFTYNCYEDTFRAATTKRPHLIDVNA